MINWIYAGGVYMLALGIFHLFFWKMFNWKNELVKVSKLNSAVMQIMNIRLIYAFFFISAMCFILPQELGNSILGKTVLMGISLFWLGRTIEQFIFFKENHCKVHLMTFVFGIGTVIFMIPVLLHN